jgi:hypothetical protein
MIAASAVHCVLRIRGYEKYWSEYLELITGFTEEDLKPCSRRLIKKYVATSLLKSGSHKRVSLVHKKF